MCPLSGAGLLHTRIVAADLPLVWFVVLGVGDERLQLVVHPAGLACLAGRGLQGDGGGAVRRQLEVEGVRGRAQLADQPLLQPRQRPLCCVRRWVYLYGKVILLV